MIPTHLYHYTSLETLKLILETKTFRFNRLDRMNDLLEGLNKFSAKIKDNVFISSWTEEAKDALPMWKMYTNLKGIRIRMPIDMFAFEEKMEVVKSSGKVPHYNIRSKLNRTYEIKRFPIPDVKFEDPLIRFVYGPSRIDYVNSKYALKKGLTELKEVNGKAKPFKMREIYIDQFGQRKLSFWKFENEYRYRIFYGNLSMMAANEEIIGTLIKYPVLTEFIDVEFKEECLEGLEILLGPKVSRKERIELEGFVSNLTIRNYQIKKSRIRIKEKK